MREEIANYVAEVPTECVEEAEITAKGSRLEITDYDLGWIPTGDRRRLEITDHRSCNRRSWTYSDELCARRSMRSKVFYLDR